MLPDCKSTGCKKCGGKHHTSTCFQIGRTGTDQPKGKFGRKTTTTRQNVAVSSDQNISEEGTAESSVEENVEDNTILTVEESCEGKEMAKGSSDIFLLTGFLQAKHPSTKQFVDVRVLLDTGADRSFIDTKLAKELILPKLGITTMKVSTFGAKKPTQIECMKTRLNIWDAKGTKHELELFTHNTLTTSQVQGRLDAKDLKFIRKKRIKLSAAHDSKSSHPQIILGCDQLWNFIQFKAPHLTLPSGLLLIPTRMGYMVSGKTILEESKRQQLTSSLYTLNTEDQESSSDDDCIIGNGEVKKEFGGPEKEEREAVNAQVMENFNKTIERRPQGYFVRIPFKKGHDHLPDNRALALRRLENILRTYRTRPDILHQYHDVFQEQMRKNILEEVDESQECFAKHYLPHQPVLTPEKDTTKFRVIFDASAHYKNRPSLNDVVHQGPTMLPKIYEILLRLRTGPYILLSDVEKAFLQIYLHEDDRDFTRCFWVKDINQPLSQDNLVTFRFTRVTFGINASPFLLSGTILYHLNNLCGKSRLV